MPVFFLNAAASSFINAFLVIPQPVHVRVSAARAFSAAALIHSTLIRNRIFLLDNRAVIRSIMAPPGWKMTSRSFCHHPDNVFN